MEHLQNTAQVILRGNDRRDYAYCLCITEHNFVTWCIDQEGNCYWGHYWSLTLGGLIDAVLDFRTRTHCDQIGNPIEEVKQP